MHVNNMQISNEANRPTERWHRKIEHKKFWPAARISATFPPSPVGGLAFECEKIVDSSKMTRHMDAFEHGWNKTGMTGPRFGGTECWKTLRQHYGIHADRSDSDCA